MISDLARLLIEDMLEYARKALRYHSGLDPAVLEADDMRMLALIRALEVIGEAASKVPPQERAQLAAIPWRRIIDFRNLLIHGYGRIRTEALDDVARNHVPALIAELDRILNSSTEGDHER